MYIYINVNILYIYISGRYDDKPSIPVWFPYILHSHCLIVAGHFSSGAWKSSNIKMGPALPGLMVTLG
jgi:hypothetical protein